MVGACGLPGAPILPPAPSGSGRAATDLTATHNPTSFIRDGVTDCRFYTTQRPFAPYFFGHESPSHCLSMHAPGQEACQSWLSVWRRAPSPGHSSWNLGQSGVTGAGKLPLRVPWPCQTADLWGKAPCATPDHARLFQLRG